MAEVEDKTAPEENVKVTVETPPQPENPEETGTYFLRPGMEHNQVVRGEHRVLKGPNDSASLTRGQYEAFKDKFFPLGQRHGPVEDADREMPEAQAATQEVQVQDPNEPFVRPATPTTSGATAEPGTPISGATGDSNVPTAAPAKPAGQPTATGNAPPAAPAAPPAQAGDKK